MQRKLIDYLPGIMQELEEFQQIMSAEQKQMDDLWKVIYELLDEAFVDTAKDSGLRRWETILNLIPLDTDTPEVRRMRIRAKILEASPYTWNSFHQMLSSLCGADGYKMELKNDEYTLVIKVALKSKKLKNEVATMAERVVPANLILEVDLMYNTWAILKKYTWGELKDKGITWWELRNEVLD